MLSKEVFLEVAARRVKEFLPDSFKDWNVEVKDAVRVNGSRKILNIFPEEDMYNVAFPNINMDAMYEAYKKNEDMDEVLRQIADILAERTGKLEYAMQLNDMEYGKNNVIMQLINTESNKDYLADKPHREINDTSVVYKVILSHDEQGLATSPVDYHYAEKMGLNEEQLYSMACENTKRLMPVYINPLYSVICEMMTGNGMPKDMAEEMVQEMGGDLGMWVLSNESKAYGAVNMLYEDNLRKVTEAIGEDIYIIPSSVHEVLCVGKSVTDPELLMEMVNEVNYTEVPLCERLSNQVYQYERDTRMLTVALENPKKDINDKNMDKVAEQKMEYNTQSMKR